ncbi:MAG: MFS transporter, partial [Pseudomonadota bacterium]
MSATSAVQGAGYETGFGSKGYRSFVLGSLLLAYIFNFIDRVIISYLSTPIIDEFDIEYWQFGLLSGIAFATFYTFLGIPIARAAERYSRKMIIGVSIIFWSVMTALCGIASSFIMLLIFRLGVGVGEAGLTPPANSLIADYFKPKSRGAAIAIYSTGVTIGSFFAALFVALFLGVVGWRETFIVVGLGGIP